MKKLLALIAIIVVILGVSYILKDAPSTSNTSDTASGSEPDPSSATFNIEGDSVTLSSGANTSDTSETRLLEQRAYGDLNGDGKNDTVAFISNSGGASGVFIYAVAYISGPVSYKGTNAVFLGDRVSPQSVTITNGVATVKYLDREDDEPFSAEPTISTAKTLVYQNGEFVER